MIKRQAKAKPLFLCLEKRTGDLPRTTLDNLDTLDASDNAHNMD